jgi:sugar phosphate isomerase/epimerase
MFSKNIDSLPLAEAARAMRHLGFDGVDLPVRAASARLPAGRVQPDRAKTDLAGVIDELGTYGLSVPMLTTAIVGADDPYAEDIVSVAGENGVTDIKVNLWPYPGFGSFASERAVVARRLDGLEKLAQRHKTRFVLHVHSGDYMTASPFVVADLIKDRDPDAIGAYVDFEHLSLETGPASGRMALDLLGSRINAIAIKDFVWRLEGGGDVGTSLGIRRVPVGDGVVPWPQVFADLTTKGADPLVSVHSEYLAAVSWRVLSVPELIEQTAKDVQYLRSLAG